MSAVADRLRVAKALVEKGWTRGEFKRRNCYCSLGAIALATTGEHDVDGEGFRHNNYLYDRAIRAFAEAVEVGITRIVDWNDVQPSKKSVLAAFDKAIELASRTSGSAQDPTGLDPKGAGPTPKGGRP